VTLNPVEAGADIAPAAHAPARTVDLFAPGLRGLTLGLIATITLVALESLAIGTVMPIVADELGQLELYGWVYTAFFLGSLIGIVHRWRARPVPLARPFSSASGCSRSGCWWPGAVVPVLPPCVRPVSGGAVGPTAYVHWRNRRACSRACSRCSAAG
jgi:hypothetical protein